MTEPTHLTDDALVDRIAALAGRARETTASLIAHLVELERRNLHLALGYRSLYGYCRDVLHFSEAESYQRMQAAHLARRFPVILPMLAEGLLHLAGVRLLAPFLGGEDHLALLGGAIHKSKREIEELLARWYPQADVEASVRWLGSASPLSPGRYEFRFTADEETAALFREAQDLLSHSIPDGGMAAIFKRGLHLVVAEAARARLAATDRPGRPRALAAGSRTIPAEVERAVWERDGGQCSFVGRTGRRCDERRFLEYHHRKPWIVGGEPSAANITLRCGAHNRYESDLYFAPIRKAKQTYA